MVTTLAYSYEEGVWSGHDWFDEDQAIGVKNGVPYGHDPDA